MHMTFYQYPQPNEMINLYFVSSWSTDSVDEEDIVTRKRELTFRTHNDANYSIIVCFDGGFTVNRILLLLPSVYMQLMQDGLQVMCDDEHITGFTYDEKTSTVFIDTEH